MTSFANNDTEYAAFISYRHLPSDTEAAKKVQRAIEGFKLPRGMNSPAGRTLGKCFRDEDELAASHSLPEHIRAALAQSRTLIVVCTPDTSKSAWVEREIAEFTLRGFSLAFCNVKAMLSASLPNGSMPLARGR